MLAHVYKSLKRADTYVFLAEREGFSRLPEPLRTQLGPLEFVLEVKLGPERRLARENAVEVMENLAVRGFHLQFPPSTADDPMSTDWGTDA
ncbi:YcgL domain-containing protein [Luteimonas sp. e5]